MTGISHRTGTAVCKSEEIAERNQRIMSDITEEELVKSAHEIPDQTTIGEDDLTPVQIDQNLQHTDQTLLAITLMHDTKDCKVFHFVLLMFRYVIVCRN